MYGTGLVHVLGQTVLQQRASLLDQAGRGRNEDAVGDLLRR